jgi:hypothetical protein
MMEEKSLSEHIRNRIRTRIQEEFARARAQGVTGKVSPKPENRNKVEDSLTTKQSHDYYADSQAREFDLTANALIDAVQSPHVAQHRPRRSVTSWYLGDFDRNPLPSAETIFRSLDQQQTHGREKPKKGKQAS